MEAYEALSKSTENGQLRKQHEGGGRRDGCRWWKRGQLSIRRCSKHEARSVRHSQPVHNGSRAFQASVRQLKHPPLLNKARRLRHRLKRLHEGDCAFAQIIKLLEILKSLLVSALAATCWFILTCALRAASSRLLSIIASTIPCAFRSEQAATAACARCTPHLAAA